MKNFKQIIAKQISKIINIDEQELTSYIEIPKDTQNGDYAFPCFRLAKELRKAPPVIANEIKEKIVQRCIGFVPNYDDVVSDTIDSMFCGIEYKGLLKKNKKLLVKILSGDFNDKAFIERYETEKYKFGDSKKKEDYQKEGERVRKLLAQRSHNIRSFKCAIQDFERVYIKLVDSGIQDCSNWLFSFTCLMMANKAGLLPENPENSRYGRSEERRLGKECRSRWSPYH